jgi:5-methylcytosine-specific restriction endonuclease McrA
MNKNPWEKYPDIWKTQSAFLSWIRGGVRRSLWNRHPIKLQTLSKLRYKIPNPNPRGKVTHVWGADCSLCGGCFPIKDIEVDHKTGNHSLNTVDDIQSFIEGIVMVTEEDLQLVCKPCHSAKSLSDKRGISFKEALTEKKIIDIIKSKQDRQWLKDRKIAPASNAKLRREQIKKAMMEE